MASLSQCNTCGEVYEQTLGIPSLIPRNAVREVKYRFDQRRSVRSPEFRECFRYPDRCGSDPKGQPYHLDRAHLAIIDALGPSATVLETGCGGGQMRKFLNAKGHRYIGTDISPSRVSTELRRHGGPDLLADAHFLPFADSSFDVVYSAALTEHLASPHLVAQEVARVLKPGGHYLGNVSFLEPWHDDSFFHMSPLGVYELLAQAGLKPVNIWPGKGYSGFRAIMSMGNKATRPFAFLGDAAYLMYRAGNTARNLLKRQFDGDIADAARVAGATDWIARKP
jgi:SAM-dependent methyltransferase